MSIEEMSTPEAQDVTRLIPRQLGPVGVAGEQAAQKSLDQLLTSGFQETAGMDYMGRAAPGPLVGTFQQALTPITKRLTDIHASLTPRFLCSGGYYTKDMHVRIGQLQRGIPNISFAIDRVRVEQADALEHLGRNSLLARMRHQTLPPGVLTAPLYLRQGSNSQYGDGEKGCANACFRMVCADLIGQPISHQLVVAQLNSYFGDHLAENYQYLNFFHSDALKQAANRQVHTYDLIGTDLAYIARVGQNAKTKWRDCRVYCIVALGSESGSRTTIHQGVLLAADDETVTHHDPSTLHGEASRVIPKQDFVRRWAAGLNQAMLVIAH